MESETHFVSVIGVEIGDFVSVFGIESDLFVSVFGVDIATTIDPQLQTTFSQDCKTVTVKLDDGSDLHSSCYRYREIQLVNLRNGDVITPTEISTEYNYWKFTVDEDTVVQVIIYEDSREMVTNPDGTCTFTGEEIDLHLLLSQPILVNCRSLLCRNTAEKLDLENLDCTNCDYKSNFDIIDAMLISTIHSLHINVNDTIKKLDFLKKFCHKCNINCCPSC